MKTLTVNKEVATLILAHAMLPLREGAFETLSNGDMRFEIEDETYEGLLSLKFPGETISDLLVRAFAKLDGKANQ